MTLKIDTNEMLHQEAAEKFLEIMACTGDVDLCDVGNLKQAEAHADMLLSKIRDKVAAQILADARIFGEMAVEALEGGDVE